ncbi:MULTISPECIES: site-2 protease family protein [Crocosphaera]|uniref:Peptidase M50 n=1 Tax=Crocosphaera watsonii WH 8502 TaxID=423474 RepID=T2IEM2_CROWT|nr:MULTISPECIES: site-2 protease family protein [Crocosphaera]MCH2245207.1 site-2 protease family protein [Crocosphaera sp.]NQZ62380.1 site-2 protease family protein [Crocosphaera sp.]CCQ51488.1 Peptidase M50 [Crocosphaera watsonii WH 8502]
MLNTQETTTILVIILVAFGLLAWGYNRAKGYGKLGKLAWLQSVSLMTPWLVFFGLFALGIYLNIVGILFLLVASIISYIYLGKKLRSEGQDVMLQNEAAQRIQEEEAKKDENKTPSLTTEFNDSSDNKNISDLIPIPDEDLQLIKGIFSIDTFFATETISYQEGAIFRGNLRGETEESYQKLSEKLKDSFGEKYRLFLVEGSEGKPVVIILPSSDDPQPTTLVQKNLALVLLVGTVFTTLEAASILLGFDLFNNWGRYIETLPIGLALWGIFIFHEVGHRVAAKRYDIKMSVPFFLPTWQIGSFGAITRFESLIPTRNALFDVALAGPACGGILSFILLIIGLVLSHDGSLFQVPTQFFQGSILVGSLAKVVLGEQLQNAIVDVHPLTVVGWLGLVVTALNLMPAGQLDGGRIIQAIYGRKTARRATIITLVILGIVTIFSPANPIPLYWAVVILFLQRDLERPSLNELTEPDDTRAGWGLLALFLMLATLIPLSPALAGRLGIGG